MRLSISQKLNLSFLGLTVLVLIATLGLARWSFDQGFLDYVNALEQTRMERIGRDLEVQYIADGESWTMLTSERFVALLLRSAPRESISGGPARRKAPPGNGERGDGHPPKKRRPPPPRKHELGPPTALFDSSGQQIAGPRLGSHVTEYVRVPVVVRGTTVGELRSEPRRQLTSPLETAFSRQQMSTSVVIGIVSLALALIVSLLLARALLAPVRRMITGVARLSSGDYSGQLNESRTDEFGQLMSDIDLLTKTLEKSRSARRRWLADISHELRTPLTVLMGEIEALKDGVRLFDRPQLLSLDEETQRLQHLIDDLYELSLSDVGGLRYEFTTIDLKDCLETAIGTIRKRASERGIELVVNSESSVLVNADARRMDQLFRNLIENSLVYTDSPGQVEIAVTREGERAVIDIQDSPPGVTDAECENLFEPLYRRDASRSRNTAGAGLGLAICRNIVDAHGGVITAMRSKLGGLCVRIELQSAGEPK